MPADPDVSKSASDPVVADPAAAAETESKSPDGGMKRTSSLEDDAWIAEKPDPSIVPTPEISPPKILKPASSRTTSPAKRTPDSTDTPATSAVASVLAKVAAQGHTVLQSSEKVQGFFVDHAEHIQVYIAAILLLFGSYFLNTIKCFQALVQLGFLTKFGSLFSEVKHVMDENAGASGSKKIKALRKQLRPHFGEIARTLFLCATCCLGTMLSHLAGSLIIGASIATRLDGYLDEFEMRPMLKSYTVRIKKFDWNDSTTTIALMVVATLFSIVAPASATALCCLLMAAKILAKFFVNYGKAKQQTAGVDDKLDVINFRFCTGVLLACALVFNFVYGFSFDLKFKVVSLPLVIVENVIGLFA